MNQDSYDISSLLSADGWLLHMSGDDWVVPGYQCWGVRVSEIGARIFDSLRLQAPVNVLHDFLLSGIIVDDQLVPGLLDAPPSRHPPGSQPFNTWIKIRRWRADRPVILVIYNNCARNRRFQATLSIRHRSSSEIWGVPLGT
jgi:hypothetical protein